MDTGSLSRYEFCGVIGKGTYGTVYKAKDLTNDTTVALKKITLKDYKDGISPSILREVSILKRMDHPNVVSVKDFFIDEDSYYIAFEYLNQDLRGYLDRLNTPLPETVMKHYIYQLLRGLSYCHKSCVLHRDLKPHNLLIFGDVLKIGDFGLSKFTSYPDIPITPTVQTLWYRAPEILLGAEYTEKIDVWSVGCIYGEMITGLPVFSGSNQIDQLWKIFKVLGTPDSEFWEGISELKGYNIFPQWRPVNFKEIFPVLSEDGIDFLSKVLVTNPARRMTSHEALNHPYFREFQYVSSNLS